jgi:hypothetical protein
MILFVFRRAGDVSLGEMSERLMEPVLKTGDVKASVGSNPTLSARVSAAAGMRLTSKHKNRADAEVPKWPKGLPC